MTNSADPFKARTSLRRTPTKVARRLPLYDISNQSSFCLEQIGAKKGIRSPKNIEASKEHWLQKLIPDLPPVTHTGKTRLRSTQSKASPRMKMASLVHELDAVTVYETASNPECHQPPAPSATVAFPNLPSASTINPRQLLAIKREERRQQRAQQALFSPISEAAAQVEVDEFICPQPRRRSILLGGSTASISARPSNRVSFHLPLLSQATTTATTFLAHTSSSFTQPTTAFNPRQVCDGEVEAPQQSPGGEVLAQPHCCPTEPFAVDSSPRTHPQCAVVDNDNREQCQQKSKKRKVDDATPRESRWARRMEREQMRKARQSEVEAWVAQQKEHLAQRSSGPIC